MTAADVAIIGGGIAGLASAVRLARRGHSVTVLEQGALPRHRVCGEYVSLETLPFLRDLGLDVYAMGAKPLTRFELSSVSGRQFRSRLDLGGFGLSRYRLEAGLLDLARQHDVQIELGTTVRRVDVRDGAYHLHGGASPLSARLVLGCFGKRSKLDYTSERPHARRRSPYIALKRHYRGRFPAGLVGLHVVPGGYCGISAVEDDLVNVCCLTNVPALESHGGIASLETQGLRANPVLANYLDHLEPASTTPLVISQVDFETKEPVHRHVLMLGDAAGLIHPLIGNGMAMAMRAAAAVAPLASQFLEGALSRSELEAAHRAASRRQYKTRRRVSRSLQKLLESRPLSEALCLAANAAPQLARLVIRSTHGPSF